MSPEEISRRESGGHRANFCRRARAARPGRTRGGENLPHCDRVLDRGDHAQPPATAGARQYIDRERSSHQCRPRPVARPARPPDPGATRAIGDGAQRHVLRCRPAVVHDPRAPARRGGREDAVVEEQVDLGADVPGRVPARAPRLRGVSRARRRGTHIAIPWPVACPTGPPRIELSSRPGGSVNGPSSCDA